MDVEWQEETVSIQGMKFTFFPVANLATNFLVLVTKVSQ